MKRRQSKKWPESHVYTALYQALLGADTYGTLYCEPIGFDIQKSGVFVGRPELTALVHWLCTRVTRCVGLGLPGTGSAWLSHKFPTIRQLSIDARLLWGKGLYERSSRTNLGR